MVFNDPLRCDVAFVAPDGRRLHCNRQILSKACPLFRRMLSSEIIEGSSDDIHVQEVDPQALEHTLKFAVDGDCPLDDINVIEIWNLADRFDVKELVARCKEYCARKMRQVEGTACCFLEKSMNYDFHDPTHTCLEHICFFSDMTMSGERVLSLSPEALMALLKYNSGLAIDWAVPPLHILNLIVRWLGRDDTRREHLSKLLEASNLESMSSEDLVAALGMKIGSAQSSIRDRLLEVLSLRGQELWSRASRSPIMGSDVPRRRPVAVFHYCNRETEWVVPRDGYYYIIAFGAKGADGPQFAGGRGAVIGGGFFFENGKAVRILAGGTSARALQSATTGGGGATFVTIVGGDHGPDGPASRGSSSDPILLVAGGGGGCGVDHDGHDAELEAADTDSGKGFMPGPGEDGGAIAVKNTGLQLDENHPAGPGSTIPAIWASAPESAMLGDLISSMRIQRAISSSSTLHSPLARCMSEAELMRGLSLGRIESGSVSEGGFGGGGGSGQMGGGGGGGFYGGVGGTGGEGGRGGVSFIANHAKKPITKIGSMGNGKVEIWWGLFPPTVLDT